MTQEGTKHTPGPWQVAENGFSVYASDPHFVVANTLTPDSRLIGQQEELDAIRGTQRANAHILAASILMLEVLQEVEWVYGAPLMICPVCEVMQRQGHDTDCKLDIAIKAALNLD